MQRTILLNGTRQRIESKRLHDDPDAYVRRVVASRAYREWGAGILTEIGRDEYRWDCDVASEEVKPCR